MALYKIQKNCIFSLLKFEPMSSYPFIVLTKLLAEKLCSRINPFLDMFYSTKFGVALIWDTC
jgi:hypothetical protein